MNIIIIGGGTAGYLVSYELQEFDFIKSITIIESPEIGIIGTGEGSTGLFSYFVTKSGEKNFLKDTNSTYKLGVVYKDWGSDYIAPIDVPHVENQKDLYISKYNVEETHINAFLIKNNFSPYSYINEKEWKVASSVAYHFDGHEVGKFFKKKLNHKSKVINDTIIEIVSHENKITKVIGSSGEYNADYFIDCSGFSRLFAKHFNLSWEDYSDYLLIDRSLSFQLPKEMRNYTKSQAMKFGWCWEIPKRNNLGCGYNYSSQYITDEEAISECKEKYGDINPIKTIKYSPGCYKSCMGDNWNIIGISNGFLEPLEATTIHSTILNIFSMIEVFNQEKTILEHNNYCYGMSQDMRDFIQLHYFCGRNDTNFWKKFDNFEVKLSENQQKQLEYIKNKDLRSAFKFIDYNLLYPMIKGMGKTIEKGYPRNEIKHFITMLSELNYFKKYV